MDEMEAAKQLYASLCRQKGTINVVPWPDAVHGFLLKVWVAPDAPALDVPPTYHGYPVVVERRPRFSAQGALA